MNKFYTILLITVSIVFLASCSATKKAQKKNYAASQLAFDNMQSNFIEFETFSAKSKVKGKMNGKTKSFTTNIRIYKDSLIWLSVGLLGIEGGRALITPDSIKVINRLEKTYFEREIDYVKTAYNIDVDFQMLQALLTGQLELPAKETFKTSSNNNGKTQLLSNKNDITYLLNLNSEYLLVNANREEVNFDRTVQVKYDEYFSVNDKQFPKKQEAIFVQAEKEVTLQLNYSKVKLNEKLSTPFSVSSRYKKI